MGGMGYAMESVREIREMATSVRIALRWHAIGFGFLTAAGHGCGVLPVGYCNDDLRE